MLWLKYGLSPPKLMLKLTANVAVLGGETLKRYQATLRGTNPFSCKFSPHETSLVLQRADVIKQAGLCVLSLWHTPTDPSVFTMSGSCTRPSADAAT